MFLFLIQNAKTIVHNLIVYEVGIPDLKKSTILKNTGSEIYLSLFRKQITELT
jgi:hypothetical protein